MIFRVYPRPNDLIFDLTRGGRGGGAYVITIKLLAVLEKLWIPASIREIDISADIMAATCPALLCNEYLITFEYRGRARCCATVYRKEGRERELESTDFQNDLIKRSPISVYFHINYRCRIFSLIHNK